MDAIIREVIDSRGGFNTPTLMSELLIALF